MADEQYEELEEVEQRPFNYEHMRRMLQYTRPYRCEMIIVIAVMAFASILRLMEPYLLRIAVDEGIVGRNLDVLNKVAIWWLVFQVVGAIEAYIRIRILNRTGQGILFDLRQQLFDHLQWLSLRFYDGRPVGRIMSRVTNDVESINNLINSGLVTIVSQSISLIGITIVMFVLNWRLALVAFLIVPLLALVMGRLRPAMETGWRNVRKANSNINAFLNESVSGIRVIQAFGREPRNMRDFRKLNDVYYERFMYSIKIEALIWPMVDIFGLVGTCLVLILGAWMVIRDELTVGYIMAFTDYLFRFWEPISAISRVYSRVLSAMASAERIFEYLDTMPEIVDLPDAPEMETIKGRVTFEDVSFRYEDADEYVLKEINFDITPGQMVAFVGPTGAGKTSMINLLMRFYDPQEGTILVDGHDVRSVQLRSLRNQMALVLQEPFLFSGTISDNIRYGLLDATQEDVERVSKAVQVDDFVSRFDDGYDHEVQERGTRISAGQRQLISFARALLLDPRVLILDEATSSIDTQTERMVQSAMQTLLKGRTSFVIAHRLSTIERADLILVIEDGRIVERGTHRELLTAGGTYQRLYERQFAVLDFAAD